MRRKGLNLTPDWQSNGRASLQGSSSAREKIKYRINTRLFAATHSKKALAKQLTSDEAIDQKAKSLAALTRRGGRLS
jgi:hypothetical protein